MNPLDAMQTFIRVAELSSFTQAAHSLGVPRASATTAVQRLEGQLGTRLLHRTTRRVQLTQDGQAFYERCKDLLSDLDELQSMFQPGADALLGRLRVDMPLGAARNVIVPRLPEFLRRHPGVELELSSTDRRVDPVREGFDCVLRVGPLAESSLVARPLGAYRMVNCASPAYLADHGTPRSLDDLPGHRLVHYVPVLGGRSPGFEHVDDGGRSHFVPMAGALTVNNSDAYVAACLAGIGIIQVPEPAMRGLIEGGHLVDVLPHHRPAPMPVNLLYANRRHLPKRVLEFMNWVDGVMRPYLAATPLHG
jgi:DNA-binding transcriptional LysR family regulator